MIGEGGDIVVFASFSLSLFFVFVLVDCFPDHHHPVPLGIKRYRGFSDINNAYHCIIKLLPIIHLFTRTNASVRFFRPSAST